MKNINTRVYSRYFKAFGDPSRLRIMSLLSGGEMSVNEITAAIGLSQPTVSRHLAILRDAEIVTDRREGQQIFYSINKNTVRNCCSGFCDCLEIKVENLEIIVGKKDKPKRKK